MPRIMVWNIREFGAASRVRNDYAGVVDFVAILLAHQQADVLVIEEFREAGFPYLGDLVQALNGYTAGNWEADYLPGAVVNDNRPNLTFADLGFTTTANLEGYAVLWNQGQAPLAPIANDMSALGSVTNPPTSCLNLVTLGRQPDINPQQNVPIQPAAAGGNANHLGFPVPACSSIAEQPMALRGGNTDPRGTIFSMTQSRCPCYCLVNVAGGQVQAPFVVYHAPNGNGSSFYGTLITGLAGPLQGPVHAAVAGDFNITAPNRVQFGFDNFTNANANNMAAGTPPDAHGNYPSSMVKYVDNVFNAQNLIAADVKAETEGGARDQLFYRPGQMQANAAVVDLIDMLRQNHGNLATAVLASVDIRHMVRNAIPPQNNHLPPIVANSQQAIADLENTFTVPPAAPAAVFANYRTIAIFLNCFISDHLPLVIDV